MHDLSKFFTDILGKDGFDTLEKNIVKRSTGNGIDPTEYAMYQMIAPRALMSWLVQNIKPLKQNEPQTFKFPGHEDIKIEVERQGNDQYRGQFTGRDGKAIHKFDGQTLPVLAGHFMSTLELYDHYKDAKDEPKDLKGFELPQKVLEMNNVSNPNIEMSADAKGIIAAMGKLVDALVGKVAEKEIKKEEIKGDAQKISHTEIPKPNTEGELNPGQIQAKFDDEKVAPKLNVVEGSGEEIKSNPIPKKLNKDEYFKSKRPKIKALGTDPLQEQVTPQKGVSEAGIEVRRADPKEKGVFAHGISRIAEPEWHKERAKKYFNHTLNKLKSQSKPALKSEERKPHSLPHPQPPTPNDPKLGKGIKEDIKHGLKVANHHLSTAAISTAHAADNFVAGLSDPFGERNHESKKRVAEQKAVMNYHQSQKPVKPLGKEEILPQSPDGSIQQVPAPEALRMAEKTYFGKKKKLKKDEILEKPYVSEAQRRWAHTFRGKKALGGAKAVHEWDEATKGKKLPEHVKKAAGEELPGGAAIPVAPSQPLDTSRPVQAGHSPQAAAAKTIASPSNMKPKDYFRKQLGQPTKVMKSELLTECEHCSTAQFKIEKNTATFTPCSCFQVLNKTTKPFVTATCDDHTAELKFDRKADQEQVKAFLTSLKKK